jgi:hypothetical protein
LLADEAVFAVLLATGGCLRRCRHLDRAQPNDKRYGQYKSCQRGEFAIHVLHIPFQLSLRYGRHARSFSTFAVKKRYCLVSKCARKRYCGHKKSYFSALAEPMACYPLR